MPGKTNKRDGNCVNPEDDTFEWPKNLDLDNILDHNDESIRNVRRRQPLCAASTSGFK